MNWRTEIEDLLRRRKLAAACGGPEAVTRHHAAGKLTLCERIDGVLDPNSFREVGKLAGGGTYDKSASGHNSVPNARPASGHRY